VFSALRFYWIAAKGYRLRPWASPYIRWRMETFFGKKAAPADAGTFFRLVWRERARIMRFAKWADDLRRDARRCHRIIE
jgi:hypothetical protein